MRPRFGLVVWVFEVGLFFFLPGLRTDQCACFGGVTGWFARGKHNLSGGQEIFPPKILRAVLYFPEGYRLFTARDAL